jgi:hypothetical protein
MVCQPTIHVRWIAERDDMPCKYSEFLVLTSGRIDIHKNDDDADRVLDGSFGAFLQPFFEAFLEDEHVTSETPRFTVAIRPGHARRCGRQWLTYTS